MTYHSISKYPTVCDLMTIQMGEIIRFQLVSNLYRLSGCKWRLIGKSIAGFCFIDSANVWLPVTSIQARAKSHVTCAEVRKQDRHTSLRPIKFQGGRFFLQEGDFFAAFQKDNTCYWQKRSIPLAFTDTKPIKQGKIEKVSYLRY